MKNARRKKAFVLEKGVHVSHLGQQILEASISLITILIHPRRVVRLIDVSVLGKTAFTTASNNGKTLKSILEDPDIPKCAWPLLDPF
jgi:hypothetical protein